MTPRPSERGAALLTVLLLVAVMATVAATALDRITLATRLHANVSSAGNARAWLGTAEWLAAVRIEDLLAADAAQTTLAGGWMGRERTIALPDGGTARATVNDGGNCFNLNSLVFADDSGARFARPRGIEQFTGLMVVIGIPAGEAERIAAAAADWIDSDSAPSPAGAEDNAYAGRPGPVVAANTLMADASELRAVNGMSARHYAALERWICALPVAELSPININTLLPAQAPLLAMLSPRLISPTMARAQLAARPVGGYGSVDRFWNSPVMREIDMPAEVAEQVRTRTDWFLLEASVSAGGLEMSETALIDARRPPARVVRRQWGETG